MIMFMYRNSEGYCDPTAGEALGNIRREEKKRLKAQKRKKNKWSKDTSDFTPSEKKER